jgi:Putative bacterial sensory transduction regulator
MRTACFALAGGLLLSGGARAAEPVVLVDHWSEPLVERLLQSLGATELQRTTLAGQPGVIARTADGLSIGVYAKACSSATTSAEPFCRGIEGITSFDPGRGADRLALAVRLNHQYAAGKFMVEGDGSIRLTRYIDVDAGVSEANLREQLGGFLALAGAAKDAVWAEPTR